MRMNKKEAAKILAILKANYPQAKIENAEATARVWEMNLGSYSAQAVFNAAKLHMATSEYFPNCADIIKKITRAELIYVNTEPESNRLQAGSQIKAIEAHNKEEWTEERLDAFWEFMSE
jgi:hypothetical protein